MVKDDSLFVKIWGKRVAKRGWTQVPNALIEAQGLLGIRSTEMVTIIATLSFMWKFEAPYPSVNKIAQRAGLNRSTVQRHFRMLEKRELVKRIYRFNKTNAYDISPLLRKLDAITKEQLESGVYQSFDMGGVKELIANKTNSNNTSISRTKRGES